VEFTDIEKLIVADGLRLVLVKGTPSPWGQAAKAMMEYKGLSFQTGAQIPNGPNTDLVAWAGVNSGPVVAWNDEPPVNRWNDILLLIERLAPEPGLVPTDMADRTLVFGLGHEICGELGFGWNRRLSILAPSVAPGTEPGGIAGKYGFNSEDLRLADQRAIALLQYLAAILHRQAEHGSAYFIGKTISAVDFYWAAFSNLAVLQSEELCPLQSNVRPVFERTSPEVLAAIDPILLDHRDRIMAAHFVQPMEF
jgi:glutathione S-transferase